MKYLPSAASLLLFVFGVVAVPPYFEDQHSHEASANASMR